MTGKTKPCPTCGKPRVAEFVPFCSKRCADADLGRWFDESYSIPVPIDEAEMPTDDGDDPAVH